MTNDQFSSDGSLRSLTRRKNLSLVIGFNDHLSFKNTNTRRFVKYKIVLLFKTSAKHCDRNADAVA